MREFSDAFQRDAYVAEEKEVGSYWLQTDNLSIWKITDVDANGVPTWRLAAGIGSYTRVFDHADTDIAVAAGSAAISLGDPLPQGAVVLGVFVDNTEDWTDGSAGTFAADVGDGTDADAFTPTALDIDNGVARLDANANQYTAAGEVQLTVTISGSVDLDTLTAGTMSMTILWCVPNQAEVIAAP